MDRLTHICVSQCLQIGYEGTFFSLYLRLEKGGSGELMLFCNHNHSFMFCEVLVK
jgi:hypothetical protein